MADLPNPDDDVTFRAQGAIRAGICVGVDPAGEVRVLVGADVFAIRPDQIIATAPFAPRPTAGTP